MRDNLKIVSALLVDFLLLAFMASWTMFGGSWRFIISVVLVYITKAQFLALFKMRGPEGGDQWQAPWLYSLTV